MSELLTQSELAQRELENRLDAAREDDRPRVPGFGSLEQLEAEHQRIQAELENTRRSVADKQRHLESSILRLETLKENLEAGDTLVKDFEGMFEHGVFEFFKGNFARDTASVNKVLQGLSELPARREFVSYWPTIRKALQAEIRELDKAVKALMKEDKAA